MTSSPPLSLVVPAAGIGSRMQSDIPKQYLSLFGKTVIEHTLDVFLTHALISEIVVCLHPNDKVFRQLSIATHPKIHLVNGGETRAESVLNGLNYLQSHSANDWVLVHDAARPGLSQSALQRLIDSRTTHHAAILALPVVDTLKKACTRIQNTSASNIKHTVDRTQLWQAQTPQMFNIEELTKAMTLAQQNNAGITDEASAMEMTGTDIALIEGEASNLKITRPEDLALAEFYLQRLSQQPN